MKASRFTAEQIVAILREAAAGTQARELCRKHGITETTFYRWRGQYGGLLLEKPNNVEHKNRRQRQSKAAKERPDTRDHGSE